MPKVSFQTGRLKIAEAGNPHLRKGIPVNIINPGNDKVVRLHLRAPKDPQRLMAYLKKYGITEVKEIGKGKGVKATVRLDDEKAQISKRLRLNKVQTPEVESVSRATSNQILSFLNTGQMDYKTIRTEPRIRAKKVAEPVEVTC